MSQPETGDSYGLGLSVEVGSSVSSLEWWRQQSIYVCEQAPFHSRYVWFTTLKMPRALFGLSNWLPGRVIERGRMTGRAFQGPWRPGHGGVARSPERQIFQCPDWARGWAKRGQVSHRKGYEARARSKRTGARGAGRGAPFCAPVILVARRSRADAARPSGGGVFSSYQQSWHDAAAAAAAADAGCRLRQPPTRPSDFHCFGELELGPGPTLAHVCWPGT